MRQYRGRSVETNEWVYGCFISGGGKTAKSIAYIIGPDADFDEIIEVHPDTVGQSTGQSLAEQTIHDGDTLKSFHFVGDHKKERHLYHDVYWSDRYGGWHTCNHGEKTVPEKDRKGSPPLWVYLRNSKKTEIVGTIHDQPLIQAKETR